MPLMSYPGIDMVLKQLMLTLTPAPDIIRSGLTHVAPHIYCLDKGTLCCG